MYIHWLYNLRIIHPERLSAYYIEDRTAEPSEMPCQKFYRCEGSQDFDTHFPHLNWVLILSLQFTVSSTLSIMAPSLYQFITTPPSLPDEYENEKNNSRFWPGLGGTDTDYAWTLAASSFFELFSVPLALFLTHRCPFRITLVIGPLISAAGGAVYALAVNVWMIFLGRGMCGLSAGLCVPILHTYIGEMGTVMDDIKKKRGKKPRKFTLYIAHSFIMNGGFLVAFGLSSIMSQFRDVNPYRWPGWFIAAQSLLQALAALIVFTETRTVSCYKILHFRCSCLSSLKLSSQLKSKWNLQAVSANKQIYTFLIACGFIIGQFYMFFYTMVTPILSDKFGFSVEYSSYFFLGISVAFCLSSLVQLGTKAASIDNRKLLGMCFVSALIGSALVGDWQSIGHDPCSSEFLSPETSEELQNDFGSSWLNNSSAIIPIDEQSNGTSDAIRYLVEKCESLNSSTDQCFWNPQSRITGEFCNTCLDTCLSIQKSLGIYQFSVGMFLLAISTAFAFVLISAISSDITSVHSQGAILTLVLGSAIVSRGISPYWFVKSYDLTGKHTYCAMAINCGCALVLLFSLVALYKNLAPKCKSPQVIALSATSNPALFDHQPLDIDTVAVTVQTISHYEVQ